MLLGCSLILATFEICFDTTFAAYVLDIYTQVLGVWDDHLAPVLVGWLRRAQEISWVSVVLYGEGSKDK